MPGGFHGVLLGKIHTDHWNYQHLVNKEDCIISPVWQFHLFSKEPTKPRKPKQQQTGRFHIKVPHIVQNISSVVANAIQVYKLDNADKKTETLHCLRLGQSPNRIPGTSFGVDAKYVHIFARHFCKFLVKAEAIVCCSRSAGMFVFSGHDPDNAMAHVSVWTSSPHFKTPHYLKVSTAWLGSNSHRTRDATCSFEEIPLDDTKPEVKSENFFYPPLETERNSPPSDYFTSADLPLFPPLRQLTSSISCCPSPPS